METFNKTMHSMLDSTIWQESSDTRVVWVTMLLMANKDGEVFGAIPGLAKRANVSLVACEEALETLSSPDKYSRTKTDEGRRIREIEGGWIVTNYKKYRGETEEEKRKRWSRNTTARYRAKRSRVTEVTENTVTVTECDRSDSHQTKIRSRGDLSLSSDPVSDGDFDSRLRDWSTRERELSLRTAEPKMTSSSPPCESLPVKRKSAKKKKKLTEPTEGSLVFAAYSRGYRKRYGENPVRNARSNTLCKRLVDRLGFDDAISVAEYYPSVKSAYDAQRGHSLAILLADCEKHRTAMITGEQITSHRVRRDDRRETTRSALENYLAKRGKDDEPAERQDSVHDCNGL